MNILTVENSSFSMNNVSEKDSDLHFCVLDYSNKEDIDYLFPPLLYLETFVSPAAELKIGDYYCKMPLDWSVMVGEKEFGEIEIIPLTSLNSRNFNAFVFNPIAEPSTRKGFIPHFWEIEIVMIYPDIKWFLPKLKNYSMLTVPIEEGNNPYCSFFCKETSKISDVIDVGKLV